MLPSQHPLHALLNPPQEGDSSGESKEMLVKTYLIPIGSLLIAGLSLIGTNASRWVVVTVVCYLGVVVVLLVVPLARHAMRWISHKRRTTQVAREFYPRLQKNAALLVPHLAQDYAETVFAVTKSATFWDEVRNRVKPDASHLTTLSIWLRSICDRLHARNQNAFRGIASEFGDLILQYSRLCEDAHSQLQALVTEKVLPEHKLRDLKQNWNQATARHNQFLKSWEDIASELNGAAVERVCFDRYPLLKTIE